MNYLPCSILKENSEIRLLDVRTQHERETASLDNSVLLDQELVEEILGSWDQNTPLMFFCHVGERSRQAAQYFTSLYFFPTIFLFEGSPSSLLAITVLGLILKISS